jgi:hypothetical protein
MLLVIGPAVERVLRGLTQTLQISP